MRLTMLEEYEKLRQIVGTSLDSPGMGGNISIKGDGFLYIKASGQDMKHPHKCTILEEFGNIDNYHTKSSLLRPSMEWEMHKLIPSKLVIHYHPVYVMPFLCAKNPNKYIKYGNIVKYATPGKSLTNELRKLQKVEKLNNIIFLLNHGVVIHADTIEEIKELYNKIKLDYFLVDNTMFTPDDVVDTKSSDLYLFRVYINHVAQKLGITLLTLNDKHIMELKTNTDEIYRQEQNNMVNR